LKKQTKKVIIGLLASMSVFGSITYAEEIQTATVDTLNFVYGFDTLKQNMKLWQKKAILEMRNSK